MLEKLRSLPHSIPNLTPESLSIPNVVDNITQTSSQWIENSGQTLQQVKETATSHTTSILENVSQTTSATVQNVSENTLQLGESLKNSATSGFQSLEQLPQQTYSVVNEAVGSALTQQFQQLQQGLDRYSVLSYLLHFLSWSMLHPVRGAIAFLVIILLIRQVFRNWGSWLDDGFGLLLQLPWKATQLILNKIRPQFVKTQKKTDSETEQERLMNLLAKMELLRQEQQLLWQEIQDLLITTKKAAPQSEAADFSLR